MIGGGWGIQTSLTILAMGQEPADPCTREKLA